MAVFQFTASDPKREDHRQSGTVVARDEAEARQKLKPLNCERIRLKKVGGLTGLIKSFTADIK